MALTRHASASQVLFSANRTRAALAGIRLARDERGVALLMTLMSTALLMALGGTLIVITTTETRIAANFREGTETFYAADAALERMLPDLRGMPDWNRLLDGSVRSSLTNGPHDGRTLGAGATLSLAEVTNLARCGKSSNCTASEMDAYTAERPSGPNNPRWQPYAYGGFQDFLQLPGVDARIFIVVLIGDDPFENDGNPFVDGADRGNPGSGIVLLRSHAYGPLGAHRAVEAIVRREEHGMRVLAWQELR